MDDIYFQIVDEDDNIIAEVQVYSDMDSFWVSSDESHRVIISANNDDDDDGFIDFYEEEFDPDVMNELYNEKLEEDNGDDKGSHLVDGVLDYLDKHNRNTGY